MLGVLDCMYSIILTKVWTNGAFNVSERQWCFNLISHCNYSLRSAQLVCTQVLQKITKFLELSIILQGLGLVNFHLQFCSAWDWLKKEKSKYTSLRGEYHTFIRVSGVGRSINYFYTWYPLIGLHSHEDKNTAVWYQYLPTSIILTLKQDHTGIIVIASWHLRCTSKKR